MSPSKPVLHSDKDVECHWKALSISIKLCLKEKKKKIFIAFAYILSFSELLLTTVLKATVGLENLLITEATE